MRVLAAMVVAAGCLSLAATGCRAPEPIRVAEAPGRERAGLVDDETIRAMADAQERRLARLAHLHRLGTASFAWTDSSGRTQREPQLEMTLFHRAPSDLAVELRKFGIGTIFWFGADDDAWWVFDLRPGEERVLYAGDHVTVREADESLIPPAAVTTLFGLSPFPRSSRAWRRLADGTLVVRLEDDLRRALVFLDEATALPTRIEVAPRGWRHRLIAVLEDDRFIDVPGVAPFDRPRLAHRVDIVRDDRTIQLVLRLDAPEASPPVARWDRLFDLEGLIGRFQPERTEQVGAP